MSEMAPQPLVQEGGVPQHPASDRGMIDTQTTFCHHLFQIAIAEGISKVPPHTQHDDLFLEVSSSEQSWPLRSHSAYFTNAAPLFSTLPLTEAALGLNPRRGTEGGDDEHRCQI